MTTVELEPVVGSVQTVAPGRIGDPGGVQAVVGGAWIRLTGGGCTVVASTGAVGGGEEATDGAVVVTDGTVVVTGGTVVVVGGTVVVVGGGHKSVGIVVSTLWLVTKPSSNVAVAVSETEVPAFSLVPAVTVVSVNELESTARLNDAETMWWPAALLEVNVHVTLTPSPGTHDFCADPPLRS